MPEKSYVYNGPVSGVTLEGAKRGDPPREVPLLPGETVELPADHPRVVALLAQGLLEEDASPPRRRPVRAASAAAAASGAAKEE